MYPELTDEALTDLLREDDPLALETLFNRYYKSLCQFCTVYTKDYEAGEEIIADLFIRLWDNRHDSTILKIKSYLFVSAKNLSLNYKQKKKDPVSSLEDLESARPVFQDFDTPFHILSGRESYDQLFALIDQLPVRQRQVLLLSRVDDLGKDKIARLLGISTRTVETTLYQSIKQLRLLLKNSRDFSARG